MKAKILIFLVLLLFLGSVAGLGYHRAHQSQGKAPVPVIAPEVVRVAALELRTHKVVETFYGKIVANAELNMAFQIPGRLSQLGPTDEKVLRENDIVARGDVLAVIEPKRYQAALAAAKAQLSQARADREGANAAVKQASAVLEDAQREHAKQLDLLAKQATKQREVERAETAEKVAKAELDAAEARQQRAQAVYESAAASLLVAEVNLADATILSPIDGRVAAVPHEVGTMMQPGQMVMRLVDLSKVKLVIGVVERKLPQVAEGQQVEVEIHALTATVQATQDSSRKLAPRRGRVTIVPPAANPATGLFDVEIELKNEDGALRPGMIGKAKITLRESDRAIALPVDAVRRRGDQVSAFFVTEGYPVGLDLGGIGKSQVVVPTTVVKEVTFTRAVLDDRFYLVFDVPAELEWLVVEGQTRVADGKPVTVLNEGAYALRNGKKPAASDDGEKPKVSSTTTADGG